MVSEGKGRSLEVCVKSAGTLGLWKQFVHILEMAGRGAAMAPFIGELTMRDEVRGE
ncbi:hypothetical protein D3C86_1176540 [compost metagenome]